MRILRLAELELFDREWRMVGCRIRAQSSVCGLRKLACLRFPAVKRFDIFDLAAIPRSIKHSFLNWPGSRICRRSRQCINQFIKIRTFKLRIRLPAFEAGSFGQDARRREDNLD